MAILDYFVRKQETPSVDVCMFSSSEKGLVDYSRKFDRSEKLTYEGIGKVKYGTGVPPAVYDTAVASVKQYPIVYGCISAISEAIAGLTVKVYEVKGGQEAEVTDHPFYQVFANPNPFQGSFEFMEQVQQSLDVTGNAFISIEKVAGTFELYLLPTKYMAIIPDPKKKIKEYHYYINGQSIKYKPEEVIHIKYNDIDDSYYGAPPLSAASDILTFESYRIQFTNAFFKNSAIPAGILEGEQVLGDTMLKKLRGEWEKIHQGINNAHKVAVLQGGLKYKPLSSPIKDLDLGTLKRLSKEDIQTIFKIPDSVLGSMEGVGSNEGKEALAAFWRGSLIPRIARLESAINRGLKSLMFGEGKQVFRFNLTEVEALSDDKESTARFVSQLVTTSLLTINEGRALLGFPASKDPNGDTLMVSNANYGNQLIPADQAGQGANPSGANTPKPTVKPKPADKKPAAKPKQ